MAQKPKSRAESEHSKRNALIAAGVATGIGSAALVAALLYANREKKADKPSPDNAEPTD
jgi:hypothetical protein